MTAQARLDHCAEEQIHLCGAIQPHGVLLSVALADWTVAHASANAGTMFGLSISELVGTELQALVGVAIVDTLRRAAASMSVNQPPVPVTSTNLGPNGTIHELGMHVSQGLAHIEIEEIGNDRGSAQELSQQMVLSVTSTVAESLLTVVADEVRQLTGYDRVMVYRFLEDQSGEVVAEARAPEVPSYLGLRFPASDIPPQARSLYVSNRVRIIPDIHYEPQPLVPQRMKDGAEVDLGQAYLRSVSPVHVQYLANMGVAASMSISIVCEGRLWGLIACHHLEPRAVSPIARRAAYLFGLFVSMRVESEHLRRSSQQVAILREKLPFLSNCAYQETLRVGVPELTTMRRAFRAHAACLVDTTAEAAEGRLLPIQAMRDVSVRLGGLRTAVHWSHAREEWTTDTSCPYAGLLAIRVGQHRWLVLLRRERITEVTWAGRPEGPFQRAGSMKIGPRESFQAWTQMVAGRSTPWMEAEIDVASELQRRLRQWLPASGIPESLEDNLASNEDSFDTQEDATGAT